MEENIIIDNNAPIEEEIYMEPISNIEQNDSQKLNKMILEKLEEISIRLDFLEKNQINAIVESKNFGDLEIFNKLGTFGLPATSKEDLDKLEFDLLKPDVKESLVSIHHYLRDHQIINYMI